MTQTREKPVDHPPAIKTPILSGLFSGAFCAGFFNPWDRGLYLSIKHQRPFLSAANFAHPFQGVFQAVVQRSFAWGSYYMVQGEMRSYLKPLLINQWHWSESGAQLVIGLTAGSVSAFVNNPLSVIKYHTWGNDKRRFISSILEHWNHDGLNAFTKGLGPTLARDMVFGVCYEEFRHLTYQYMRHFLPNNHENPGHFVVPLKFGSDVLAAGLATIFSSPFNYVRNIHYATPVKEQPQSMGHVLKQLYQDANSYPSRVGQLGFFRERLRIGWGTARVAAGMAVGQLVFDQVSQWQGQKLS